MRRLLLALFVSVVITGCGIGGKSSGWNQKATLDEGAAYTKVWGFSDENIRLYHAGLQYIIHHHLRVNTFTIGQVIDEERNREKEGSAPSRPRTPQEQHHDVLAAVAVVSAAPQIAPSPMRFISADSQSIRCTEGAPHHSELATTMRKTSLLTVLNASCVFSVAAAATLSPQPLPTASPSPLPITAPAVKASPIASPSPLPSAATTASPAIAPSPLPSSAAPTIDTVLVPRDTTVVVATKREYTSSSAFAGQKIRYEVSQDVIVNGRVIAKAGDTAYGTIAGAQTGTGDDYAIGYKNALLHISVDEVYNFCGDTIHLDFDHSESHRRQIQIPKGQKYAAITDRAQKVCGEATDTTPQPLPSDALRTVEP